MDDQTLGTAAWYVLETKRYKERAVQGHLAREGTQNTYLPLLLQWPRPAVGSDIGPLFPGYLFAQMQPQDLHRLLRTAGVRGVVTFGEDPARLDDAVIAFLRSREGADGVIRANPPPTGREVVITDGPLRGLLAIVEQRLTARQRVVVLLDLLRRQTRIEMPERWIRLA